MGYWIQKIRSGGVAVVMLAGIMILPVAVMATNGYFAHGYGSRYKGMAGAGAALYLSPMGVATNPAVVSFLGKQFYFGASLFSPIRQYTVSGNPSPPPAFGLAPGTVESGTKAFVIPAVGISLPLAKSTAIGFAIYGNGGMNTTYDAPTFGFKKTGVDLIQVFLAGTISQQLAPGQSVGVTGIFAYQRFKAEGLQAFAPFSSDPANLTNNNHSNSVGGGARFGYLGEFGKYFSIGGSYQTKISMGKFDEYRGLFAEQGGFDIPANWVVGVAIKPTSAFTIAVDVQRILYNDIKSIANLMNPAFQQAFGILLSGGDPSTSPFALGADGGPGFGWQDMTTVKVGFQVEVSQGFQLRGGFSGGDQPIPDSEVLFNILAPGVIQNHITAGFTKQLSPKVALNGAFMFAPNKSVTGTNPADPAQTIELKMHQFEGEFSLSIDL